MKKKRTKRIQIRLSEEELKKLDEHCALIGETRSEFLREYIHRMRKTRKSSPKSDNTELPFGSYSE